MAFVSFPGHAHCSVPACGFLDFRIFASIFVEVPGQHFYAAVLILSSFESLIILVLENEFNCFISFSKFLKKKTWKCSVFLKVCKIYIYKIIWAGQYWGHMSIPFITLVKFKFISHSLSCFTFPLFFVL